MYLNSHLLEVMSSPADQIPEAEDGTVQMGLFVVSASFQVAVIRGVKDVGPSRPGQNSRHEAHVSNVRLSGTMATSFIVTLSIMYRYVCPLKRPISH